MKPEIDYVVRVKPAIPIAGQEEGFDIDVTATTAEQAVRFARRIVRDDGIKGGVVLSARTLTV